MGRCRQSATSSSDLRQRRPDTSERFRHITDHELRIQPEHAETEPSERSVPAGVRRGATGMIRAVHFHYEPSSGCQEVHDESASERSSPMLPSSLRSLEHGALPLERNAELAAPQREPQKLLRQRSRLSAHSAGTLSEELGAMG